MPLVSARSWLLAGLALAAAVLSAWLGFLSAVRIELPGCGGDSGCASVAFTRWSQSFSVSVGFIGAVVYLMVVVGSLSRSHEVGGLRLRVLRFVQEMLAVAIGLAVLWFVGLQLLGVTAICPYCLAVHALGAVVALLLWNCRRIELSPDETSGSGRSAGAVVGGISGFCVLLAGQFLGTPPDSHAVSRYIYGRGKIRISSDEAPVLGNREAPHVVLELFDYTCPTCRQLAPQLSDALERYGGQFAVLLVPCPIERKCNPHLLPSAVEHPGGCAYARSAMAVWTAAPDKFPGFHEWLILSDPIPTLEATNSRAIELVGKEAYEKAKADQQSGRPIARGIDLYRGVRQGVMPKLLLGDRMIQGVPQSADKLFEALEEALPLRPASGASIDSESPRSTTP